MSVEITAKNGEDFLACVDAFRNHLVHEDTYGHMFSEGGINILRAKDPNKKWKVGDEAEVIGVCFLKHSYRAVIIGGKE